MSDLANKVLENHFFVFNKRDNGGESLSLETKFISNGDDGKEGIFMNQILRLQSYCNSASFDLVGAAITPQTLRELADQLEVKFEEAANKNINE